jgi:hypothetical protein
LRRSSFARLSCHTQSHYLLRQTESFDLDQAI